MAANILRINVAKKILGLSRSAIYARLSEKSKQFDPQFPKLIKLGERASGFVEAELDVWLKKQIEKRDAKGRGDV